MCVCYTRLCVCVTPVCLSVLHPSVCLCYTRLSVCVTPVCLSVLHPSVCLCYTRLSVCVTPVCLSVRSDCALCTVAHPCSHELLPPRVAEGVCAAGAVQDNVERLHHGDGADRQRLTLHATPAPSLPAARSAHHSPFFFSRSTMKPQQQ